MSLLDLASRYTITIFGKSIQHRTSNIQTTSSFHSQFNDFIPLNNGMPIKNNKYFFNISFFSLNKLTKNCLRNKRPAIKAIIYVYIHAQLHIEWILIIIRIKQNSQTSDDIRRFIFQFCLWSMSYMVVLGHQKRQSPEN